MCITHDIGNRACEWSLSACRNRLAEKESRSVLDIKTSPCAIARRIEMAAVSDRATDSSDTSSVYSRAQDAVSFLQSKLPRELQNPRVAIVCGSGLGGIADLVSSDKRKEIDYVDIPNFPKTTGKGDHILA